MNAVSLLSPAKINLYLKVLNKRPDGYHNLKTIFERIDLSDEIRFKATRDSAIRITCDNPDVPTSPRNLGYQVAERLQSQFALKDGVHIHIKKRIPVAAGLGGGSSNAATTILGLNKIWKLRLTQRDMLDLGSQIGADVPFFLYDIPWGMGAERGDVIKPLSVSVKLWHILVVPRLKLRTPRVYGGLKLQLTKPVDNVNILIRNLQKSNISKLGSFLLNDLEISSFRLCPKLLLLKNRLVELGALGAALSGSGPSVFGLAKSRKHAQELKLILEKRNSQVFVVRTY